MRSYLVALGLTATAFLFGCRDRRLHATADRASLDAATADAGSLPPPSVWGTIVYAEDRDDDRSLSMVEVGPLGVSMPVRMLEQPRVHFRMPRIQDLAFTPDGRHLLVASMPDDLDYKSPPPGLASLVRFSISDGTSTELARCKSNHCSIFGETSDGTVWYVDGWNDYRDGRRVMLLAPGATSPREWVRDTVAPWGPCQLAGPAISRDGEQVFFGVETDGNEHCRASAFPGLYVMKASDAKNGPRLERRMLCSHAGALAKSFDLALDGSDPCREPRAGDWKLQFVYVEDEPSRIVAAPPKGSTEAPIPIVRGAGGPWAFYPR